MKYLAIQLSVIKLLLLLISLLATTSCTNKDPPTVPSAPATSVTVPATAEIVSVENAAGMIGTAGIAPNATIREVIDGDTVIADIAGSVENVRLIGIDTPESVATTRPKQCYGAEASDYLKSLLPTGTAVTLILDVQPRDQYDRLLAYVIRSHDELFVNLDLVKHGYAGTLSYPPNTYYKSLFSEAAKSATRAKLGLWGACGDPDVPLE